jgi:putative spermidine/putrescine transport system permease protein
VLLSVFVATASALLSTVLGTMLAYAMARRNFPGKRALMLLFLLWLDSSRFLVWVVELIASA